MKSILIGGGTAWATYPLDARRSTARAFGARGSRRLRRGSRRFAPVLYVGALRAPRRFGPACGRWLPTGRPLMGDRERSEPRTDERRAAARSREPTRRAERADVENRMPRSRTR